MNLDDLEFFKKIDTRNMLSEIDALPDQLQTAWDLGQSQPLPGVKDLRAVVLCGVGDSALGADLVADFGASSLSLPVTVHRDYGLPGFAKGKQTLVVCTSHTGNDEETLDAFASAIKNDCSIVVITTGGELEKLAAKENLPVWRYSYTGQGRGAIGFLFGLTLALFTHLELIPNPSNEVAEAVAMMKRSQIHIRAETIAAKNPAKRYAGQLVGRCVTFVSPPNLTAVARRWKMQINLFAKAGANVEILPDATHHALAGTLNPNQTLNAHTMTLFLRAPSDHPRNRLRSDMMRQAFMLEALNTDFVDARGDSLMAHLWTQILFGDYMAYYLAMAYGADPSQMDALASFEDSMK